MRFFNDSIKKQKKGLPPTFNLSNLILLIFFSVFILPAICLASGPKLVWDPNQEEDLEGYIIYFKFTQDYNNENFNEIKSDTYALDVGNVTCCSIQNFEMEIDMTYIFVVRAYNPCGESENSNSCSFVVKDSNGNNVADYLETTETDADCGYVDDEPYLDSEYDWTDDDEDNDGITSGIDSEPDSNDDGTQDDEIADDQDTQTDDDQTDEDETEADSDSESETTNYGVYKLFVRMFRAFLGRN